MDFSRFSLYTALAVVSYLLLLAWNEDNPQQAQQSVDSLAAPLQSSFDLPEAVNTNQSADLPQVQSTSAATATPAATSNNAIITIASPLQEVTIDLLGGDITSLALPKFPTSLEALNDPFILLRNDNGGVYVSQSGLIGENGPDASATGRPLYQTQQTEFSFDSGELLFILSNVPALLCSITSTSC